MDWADKKLLESLAHRVQDWLPLDEWGPECAGCGADEYRIDGFCSIECRDYHCDYELRDRLTEWKRRKALIDLTKESQNVEGGYK